MTDRFRLTLAQLDCKVGDIDGNAARALAAWERGRAEGADLVCLPEMHLSGYQPQDLVLKPAFVEACLRALERLAEATKDGPALGIGTPTAGVKRPENSWLLLQGGEIRATVRKHHLPTYGVFDEKRLYHACDPHPPVETGPLRLGVPICEDAWFPDVAGEQARAGAELLFVPNGSPYERGKRDIRIELMVNRVIETGLPLVYLNRVGGQDDQVFDGGSFVLNRHGKLAAQLPAFEEAVVTLEFAREGDGWACLDAPCETLPDVWETEYRAMVVGTRDYARKTGFKRCLLGLSGGVDSAIVAAIAADALGPENVRCVMLPSRYTSKVSLDDAAAVAKRLGCRLEELPISPSVDAVEGTLAPLFEGMAPDVTEENIQSRLRGLLLMGLSNKFGELLLTTGNKSEVAVGYATLYGDMNGGWNPIKDLYKTRVFETCRWRNAHHRDWMQGPAGEVIPVSVIEKAPSAELREDQKDEDSLPPYPVLDVILEGLIERDLSVRDIVREGHDREVVEKVERLLYLSEYKRFQSAPGPKLTRKAFWLDRRYPIASSWRDRG